MRKLDEQSFALTSRLFPTLRTYIQRRRTLEGTFENQADTLDIPSAQTEDPSNSSRSQSDGQLRDSDTMLVDMASRNPRHVSSHPSPRLSTLDYLPPECQKDSHTARTLVSHVACISEELLRASQEKVNLAQTNRDSVERHIRLIDQAIQEQIASLSLEKSRLTTGIAVHLPDVVVPEWPRKNRNSSISDDDLDIHIMNGNHPSFATEEVNTTPAKGSQRSSKKKGKERRNTEHDNRFKDTLPLTITLPATYQQDALDIQSNEEVFCYCNRVSFGEMIACDNESCDREWFHFGCVGLTEIPEGEWFCEDCRDDER
ncbi:hypothetical protein BDN70DRAFT_878508 [Pholiota conissans]|uniref:PHD-type domain-containing protein n=1 Tax=Pholiota conissans TaxID=109636 RepID=A0A9P5Z2N7_9AGAR|nr:hypothetical protein BDN70DRAFT_878508 [Pholiota conissans]